MRHLRWLVLAVPALLFVGAPAHACACQTMTTNFGVTGTERTFTVPAGVTSVRVTAVGAPATTWNSTGGRGAIVTADVPVTPGQVLYVNVGGPGDAMDSTKVGYNGGGDAGMYTNLSGGGASDVRTISRTAAGSLASRLVVAGGGGAPGLPGWNRFDSGYSGTGGAGGDAGEPGGWGGGGDAFPGEGGRAGGADAGGAPGPSGQSVCTGAGSTYGPSSFGFGGNAGYPNRCQVGGRGDGGPGGAGGGGWYGGGAGGSGGAGEPYSLDGSGGGGGGGGSNHVAASATLVDSDLDDDRTPRVVIRYTPVGVAPRARPR
jgi:hypothetical protein